jgi:hypothetical protein
MVGGLKISLLIGFLLLAYDPEKCAAVFRKDHTQMKIPKRDDLSSRFGQRGHYSATA